MNFSKKQIDDFLEGIFDGTVTEKKLPEKLYYAIADHLKKGLYKGFGGSLKDFEGKDIELITSLRNNIYMFSAAKVYTQTKEFSQLAQGKILEGEQIKTFAEFKKEVLPIYDQYNVNWLETEYSTTIGQAQSAVRWAEIEKQKDVLPLLKYSAVLDANTSDICAPLDGIVAKVDDPIWNSIAPLNHFNCRCTLEQVDDYSGAVPSDDRKEKADLVEEKMADVFKSNPGKTGDIFDKAHPYFDVPKQDRGFAKENFGMPIPEKD